MFEGIFVQHKDSTDYCEWGRLFLNFLNLNMLLDSKFCKISWANPKSQYRRRVIAVKLLHLLQEFFSSPNIVGRILWQLWYVSTQLKRQYFEIHYWERIDIRKGVEWVSSFNPKSKKEIPLNVKSLLYTYRLFGPSCTHFGGPSL